MIKVSENLKNNLSNLFLYKPTQEYDFNLPESQNIKTADNSVVNNAEELDDLSLQQKIYPSLSVNLDYLKVKYNALISKDINNREFTLSIKDKKYSAFLFYIDGMIDAKNINDFILEPLMGLDKSANIDNKEKVAVTNTISVKKIKKFNLEDYIYNSLIPQNSIKKAKDFKEVVSAINMGNCALFVDTLNIAFTIEVKGYAFRNISKPENEIVIRGSHESFVENLRTNTSLLRRIINNENLIIEETNVGKITRTAVSICYLKNITNNDLIAEVKYRINNIDVDYLLSAGQLEQLIQDNSKVAFPQIIITERPDKACNHLLEGRVIVLLNGAPYALIMPAFFTDFLSTPEDYNLKYQYSNLLKILRILAFIITLLLPGVYVAVSNFHHELLPTELLFAIAASREAVPFHILFEIILMEVSFELIREAGIRVPSPIGPTIGIVGALILGEAAVSANIISPILIIIVAFTGICSFALPDYSLSFTLRIYRFAYIVLGYLLGFVGIGVGLFIQFAILANLKSFGVSYLTPYLPVTNFTANTTYFMHPIWLREKRTDALNTKRPKSQSHISMSWKKDK